MKIKARGVGGHAKVNGIAIKNGTHSYPFDPKDPLTALQLSALIDIGLIKVDCEIPKDTVKDCEDALDENRLEIDVERKMAPNPTGLDQPYEISRKYNKSTVKPPKAPKKAKKKVVRKAKEKSE